jgi:hypothetical protein
MVLSIFLGSNVRVSHDLHKDNKVRIIWQSCHKRIKIEKIVWVFVMGSGVWLQIIGIQAPFDGIKVQTLQTGPILEEDRSCSVLCFFYSEFMTARTRGGGTMNEKDVGEALVQVIRDPQGSASQESFARAMELTKAYAGSGSATHFSAVARLFYDLFEMFETGADPRKK